MVPNIGPLMLTVNINAVSALFDKIGPGILVTHSHAEVWAGVQLLKIRTLKQSFLMNPEGDLFFPRVKCLHRFHWPEVRTIQPSSALYPTFMKLTKIPIIIYYGDNIPDNPRKIRVRTNGGHVLKWQEYGGIVLINMEVMLTVVHLPEIGIKGNTHFPFSDLNNIEIADLLSGWFREKGLD